MENESDNSENNDKYRINKGESGDGFWGKVADAWVSSSVYDSLASMAEWEDENHEAIQFVLDNDQNYYALVPKDADVEKMYEVDIVDVK
ncbi:hypothetical protein [Clostridium saccharobutylicum]|uniref:Uncharacterized protein n=1 Tax=Clostridium saccharobutylicum DSM 13864 TaxID=1345695 RepID=U5MXF5_CLOSA|nr:hypothetical protein [Clostridium saccharobutylicum]AGX44137.1 hypothetical protein CLSA_c31710 [Clostridium saccharobutylicum DSM 13864]AQR91426.1 hypothetical protein CLOSC_31510 [Clostridium saccharobutylicum]AQS01330.1 hypothetical protein CSACC_31580 [Clostridium saccharobutylicum]AQS10940.1 hypothetical protein CLOBY_30890 [Clostridium saccharobutylicum]AQS15313.1 hypothetical protein CLOSACC_31580 [Clostridium saccharobutylicum]